MDLKQEFRKLKRYYQENAFEKIFDHEFGIYFLKMRSISRSNILRELANRLKFDDICRGWCDGVRILSRLADRSSGSSCPYGFWKNRGDMLE